MAIVYTQIRIKFKCRKFTYYYKFTFESACTNYWQIASDLGPEVVGGPPVGLADL